MDEINSRSSLALAYMGDAVYELMVRERLISSRNLTNSDLHMAAVAYVSAHGQSTAAHALLSKLTPQELAVFKRGRNAHPKTISRNNDPGEYSYATALEALIGMLYLEGENERVREIFSFCAEEIERNIALQDKL